MTRWPWLSPALLPVLAAGACETPRGPQAHAPTPAPSAPLVAAEELPPAAVDSADLVERALHGGAYRILQSLVEAAPHRLSGSPGAAAAVDWGLRTMRELGLENVHRQPVTVPRWERGDPETLELLIPGAPPQPLPVLALGGSIATPAEGVTAEVVMVRSFEQLRALGDAARGKIAFFNRPMPRRLTNTFRAYGQAVPQRTNGAIEAGKAGAVAALIRSMTTALDDTPHTGAMRYAVGVPEVPAAAVSTRGAEQIAEQLRSGRPLRLRLRLSCRTLPDVESANVVGEIRGDTWPDEIVVVGGHLDAWDVGQGAHDDGAGCAHTLEAARLLLATGRRPARTLRFVLFINEENGLRGAREYARAAPGRHVAAIESDAGGFEPKGFSTTARGARHDELRSLLAPLREFGMGALIPGGGGADIAPLRQHGAELFGLVVNAHRYFDFHHSRADTLEAVHERELAMGAAAVAFLALTLADAPAGTFPAAGEPSNREQREG